VDGEFAARRGAFEAGDRAEMFDDAGEHASTIADDDGKSKTYQLPERPSGRSTRTRLRRLGRENRARSRGTRGGQCLPELRTLL
jgi:hypothetical protein